MPFFPMMLSDYHEPPPHHMWRNRSSNWDHHFGLGLSPEEIRLLAAVPDLRLSRRNPQSSIGDLKSSIIGKDGLQVCMDVHQFQPNEITVKAVGNVIVLEGKHEEREDDHGYISRNFIRKYTLPKEYDIKDITSTLSSDGVLTIKAPPPQKAIQGEKEHIIHVQQTGPAHLNVKENTNNDKKMETNNDKKNGKEMNEN